MPEARVAVLELGTVLRRWEDPETMEFLEYLANERHSLQATAMRVLARAYSRQGNEQDAFSVLDDLFQLYPAEQFAAQMQLFDLHLAAGRIEIFDLLGRRVAKLVDDVRNAGTHTVRFDASRLSSGIYVFRIEADGQVRTGRIVLQK